MTGDRYGAESFKRVRPFGRPQRCPQSWTSWPKRI